MAFLCQVLGAASTVAFVAGRDDVVVCVGAASVDFDEVVECGGCCSFAPMAYGVVGQHFLSKFGPVCFVVRVRHRTACLGLWVVDVVLTNVCCRVFVVRGNFGTRDRTCLIQFVVLALFCGLLRN